MSDGGERRSDGDRREPAGDGQRGKERAILGTSDGIWGWPDVNQDEMWTQEEIERRDQFLAMLSHELRNPMGAVLNAADALQTVAGAHGEVLEGIRVIQRQTQHMARLLDDLLDVSRITLNKIEFCRDVVDLVPLAESVIECVQHLIERKNLRLTVEINEPTLCVIGDPARLKQAQVNLLTNAAKYTPQGGEIIYCLAHTSQLRGSERHLPSGRDEAATDPVPLGQAIIRVRDSGEGIPRHMLDRVFDWFVQSESKLDRTRGGMGVGLSLARKIVEAHGGSIVAQSEGQGRGSEFTIHLPLTHGAPEVPADEPEHRFSGKRLLLVEDNEDARRMLVKTLQHKGFDVSAAADGLHGLEVCRSLCPDVAVIDLGLPKLDGYQLAREIRKVPALANMLLIALTGYGRETDRQAAAEAGFDAHLIKPLNPQELYRTIARRLTHIDSSQHQQ